MTTAGAKVRNIALVGPYLTGKTTLLENILFVTGTTGRKGHAKDGNMVGDAAPEAKARRMSVEVNAATIMSGDTRFNILDCPGSIEFLQEAHNALMGADAALIVCEADVDRLVALTPIVKFLEHHEIPHFLFVNKMDKATILIRDLMAALKGVSEKPLLLRQVPIREGETIVGFVDLVARQAHRYQPDGSSQAIAMPPTVTERVADARAQMLEALADIDDTLMEELLEEKEPPEDEIRAVMAKGVAENRLVPVFLGAAEQENGIRSLLRSLADLVPPPQATAARRGVAAEGGALVQVLKTYITAHGGKLSLARVWRGGVADGAVLNGERVAGLYRLLGQQNIKIDKAEAGDIVALGRLEKAATGDTLHAGAKGEGESLPRGEKLTPVYAMALTAERREDEVKLSSAMAKLRDEDPSVALELNAETHQTLLWGQGEIHLQVALDRLRHKYHLPLATHRPRVAYKEAIRRATTVHGRHKRQSGGHGQFGDVHLEIKPLPRGGGFVFEDQIVGGAVPRQFIPAVEDGVREYLHKGPFGFPVVDVAVALTDGQYHAVDSSEMAFKTAGRIAMTEGMAKCDPVLLEPIFVADIVVPSDFTSKVHSLVSGRRGQILGYEPRPDWSGWDRISAQIPQAELHDLIIELRSITQGVGSYAARFERLQELTGRLADQVLQSYKEAS